MLRLEYPPFHVLVALVGTTPCAIEDACNHAGASLSEGERRGACVICPDARLRLRVEDRPFGRAARAV